MNILFINQCYWPDHVATSQILADLAEELACRGHHVTVLCSRRPYSGGGETFVRKEYRNGVGIRRVANPCWGKRGSKMRRLGDCAWFFAGAAFASMALPRPDVVVTLSSPPLIGVLGRMIQLLRGSAHVNWCMDVFPDNGVEFGVIREGTLLHTICAAAASSYLKSAEVVAVLSTHMAGRIKRYGVKSTNTHIVPVWSDGRKTKPVDHRDNWFRKRYSLQDKFVVMFSGNLTYGGDIDTVIEALRELRHDKEVVFILISEGPRFEEFRNRCRSLDLGNVVFLPYQNRDSLSYSLSAADVHLVTNKKGLEGIREPCKVYGILSVGRPFILIGGPGCVAADIAYEHGVGMVVGESDVDKLVASIRLLKESPDRWRWMCFQSRRVFEKHYDALHGIDLFEDAAFAAVARRSHRKSAKEPQSQSATAQKRLPQKERVTYTGRG